MSKSLGESITEEKVLVAKSYVQQDPTGEGIANAIIIDFGGAQVSTDGGIQIDADNNISRLDDKYEYHVNVTVNIGRQSATGIVDLYGWVEVSTDGVNYVQLPDTDTVHIALDDATREGREQAAITIPRSLPLDNKLRFRFGRGAGGADQGSLYSHSPTGDFASLSRTPSASLVITKTVAL